MRKSNNGSSFQPKTVMLALSTLFLAGSLYAQPLTPPAADHEAETTPCPMQKPCGQNAPHGKRGPHKKPAMEEALRTLQLTSEQQTQLDQLADNLAQKRLPLSEQMRDVQIKLNEQVYLAQLDTATISLLQEQRNKLRQEISTLNDSARLQALTLLTPEQRVRLGEEWKQWHSSMPPKKDRSETETPPRHHAESLLFPSGPMMP